MNIESGSRRGRVGTDRKRSNPRFLQTIAARDVSPPLKATLAYLEKLVEKPDELSASDVQARFWPGSASGCCKMPHVCAIFQLMTRLRRYTLIFGQRAQTAAVPASLLATDCNRRYRRAYNMPGGRPIPIAVRRISSSSSSALAFAALD